MWKKERTDKYGSIGGLYVCPPFPFLSQFPSKHCRPFKHHGNGYLWDCKGMAYTAHTFNQLFSFICRDREYRRHGVLSSWINGISQSQTPFSGDSQSLTSFSGDSSPESHPFWRKEQTCLFYPIVASVGFSCRTLQRMHVRGLVHSYTFLFDPSIASDWRTSIAPFWTDMCCRLYPSRTSLDGTVKPEGLEDRYGIYQRVCA